MRSLVYTGWGTGFPPCMTFISSKKLIFFCSSIVCSAFTTYCRRTQGATVILSPPYYCSKGVTVLLSHPVDYYWAKKLKILGEIQGIYTGRLIYSTLKEPTEGAGGSNFLRILSTWFVHSSFHRNILLQNSNEVDPKYWIWNIRFPLTSLLTTVQTTHLVLQNHSWSQLITQHNIYDWICVEFWMFSYVPMLCNFISMWILSHMY